MKTIMDNVDEAAAIEELKGLSLNAQKHLMDRIGNQLQDILLSNHLGRKEAINRGVGRLIGDMKKIGLFELHGSWGGDARG